MRLKWGAGICSPDQTRTTVWKPPFTDPRTTALESVIFCYGTSLLQSRTVTMRFFNASVLLRKALKSQPLLWDPLPKTTRLRTQCFRARTQAERKRKHFRHAAFQETKATFPRKPVKICANWPPNALFCKGRENRNVYRHQSPAFF